MSCMISWNRSCPVKDKMMGMLGLSMKAGKAASGGFAAEKSVKSGWSYLVIVPEDASDGTKKKYTNMCDYYGVPILVTGTKETLGRALGKEERSVISVNDANFAQAIMNLCAGNK